MTRHRPSARAGITLTEILISIMILGIGVISLATLFPIGMVRLRNAQRYSRSAFLYESAAADLGSRDLLNSTSFLYTPLNPLLAPTLANTVGYSWYCTDTTTTPPLYYNPWVQDTPAFGANWATAKSAGAYRGWGGTGTQNAYTTAYATNVGLTSVFVPGEGLPVAYDPLWRFQSGIYPNPTATGTVPEARFGSGVGSTATTGLVRADPGSLGGSAFPSAHGLQRVTNLYGGTPSSPTPFANTILQTFVSPEDIILQESTGQYTDPDNPGGALASPSTVVPDLNMSASTIGSGTASGGTVPTPTVDFRYTWLFTGRQADALSGATFDGDVVICENRQFGMDTLGGLQVPAGETVVEAVWGSSSVPDPGAVVGKSLAYGSRSAQRTVVLRWLATQPDPDVRVGGWIADVTYERDQTVANGPSGRFNSLYPGQRCYWYQVAKKTDVVDDPDFTAHRRMTVWTTTPLKARTLLDFSGKSPVPVTPEAALIMPSVVNVIPRTVYSR